VAGYGSGEGIVTDKIGSDTYTVNRQLRTIEKEISKKASAMTYNSETGLFIKPVEERLRNLPALTDKQIFEVCDHIDLAEKLLGIPVDIEYSFDKNNK